MSEALGVLALVLVVAVAVSHGPLGIAALVVCAVVAAMVDHAVGKHGGRVILWRWLSGHPWHGELQTDAGWFRRGRKPLTPTGHASRWAHLPRAQRAAWRTGGSLGAVVVAWGLAAHRAATLYGLGGVALAAVVAGSWAAYRIGAGWRHHRTYVRPLHAALAGPLGVPGATRPAAWLTIPRDFHRRDGAEVRIDLPDHFTGQDDAKRVLGSIVAEKLALENPRATWHNRGKTPHVVFTAQLPPPERVTFAMVRQLMARAAETAPLLGLGRASKPVYADLDGDSPHVLVSAGSGGGKSVTTRTLVAQILAGGGVALILDVKRLSHAWARALPNVRYCRSIEEIHEALIWLQGELDRRNELADEGADDEGNTDQVDVGPRIAVLAEEMNATANRLAAYWRKIKPKDGPTTSPAVEALGDALFMGRQVKVNVFAVAQMLTARTIGGGEARENMGVRILTRYTLNAWRVLVPEIWPPPKASRHRGRVQTCVAGEARETQVAFLTPAEARELATSGPVADFPTGGTPVRLRVVGGDGAQVVPIGLAAAVRQGVIRRPDGSTISLEAVRKARQRDPEFPKPIGDQGGELLYDPDALTAWAGNRPRAAAMAG